MKKLSLSAFLVLICSLFCSTNLLSQQNLKYLSYVFASDSIQGFDENTAKQDAFNRGFFGNEYKVYMYRAKRDFITQKYGYSPRPSMDNAKGSSPVVNAAPCVNEDFEASPVGQVGATLSGWTIGQGQNNSSCTMGGCCPTAGGTDAWIRTTPYVTGTNIGTIPNSPFGGTKVLQMNDQFINVGEVVRVSQTFPVTSTNALFRLAYMCQMDGSGHACCDQPYLKISMLNCSSVPLACPSLSVTAPGAACASSVPAGWTTNTSGYSFTTGWLQYALDLTPYIGSCVTIQITQGDCTGWGHHGMAFIDCRCDPMTITVNNTSQFPAGSAVVYVSSCATGASTVSAPPGLGPYSWSGPPGSGITSNTNQVISTTVGGNYTLTMTPPGSCAPITRTVNLAFATPPTAGLTTANSCTSYTITNTGSAAPSVQSYSFAGAGAPASYTTTNPTSTVIFPAAGSYTIYQTVTNTATCVATASLVVNVPTGPNAAFNFTSPQCLSGNSFNFNAVTAAGTHTYAFNPTAGAPATGNVANYGPASFTSPGTYTVTHTVTNSGCTGQTFSVVVINPQPTVTANNNGPICLGGNLVLTGTGGGTYSWSGPSAFTSATQNPTITGVTAGQAGTYNLTVTLAGCTGTANTTVAISTPTAAAANTGPYCAGQTISLSTGAATSYTWTGPSGFSSTLQNPTIPAATAAMSGVYNVTLNLGGCFATANTNVTVTPLPVPTATNNTPVCAGTAVTLTGAGGTTYTWTGPGSYSSTTQNPVIATTAATTTGIYTLTVTGPGGCTNSVTTNVVVNPMPVPGAVNNGPMCVGGNLILTGSGGGTYSWSGPGGYTSAIQNPTLAPANAGHAGVYTVTVNLSGCIGVASTTVSISTPTAVANNSGPYCAGTTIQLSTAAATSFTWSGPGGFSSGIQNPTIAGATTAMSGVYSVTLDFSGCVASATTSVTVNPLPVPTATNNSPICQGQALSLIGGGASTYTWSGPGGYTSTSSNPVIAVGQPTNSGVYTLTVTDVNNCTNTISTTATVNPLPVPTATNNGPICVGAALNLTGGGGGTYLWNGPNGFSSAAQNPNVPVTTVMDAGVYTVTVTLTGCTGVASTTVAVLTPTASASNTGPYCAGQSIVLNGSLGTGFAWSGPAGGIPAVQNPTITNATTGMTGTYTVIVSIGSCTASAVTSLTVNPIPNPVANSNSPVCENQPINFTGAGALTYTWTGPNNFTLAVQNPTIAGSTTVNAGVYTLFVTDANGCMNSTTTPVVVNTLPVPVVNNPTVCVNQTINLTANGGTGYAWNGPLAFTSSLQNPSIPNATSAMSGQYTVLVTSAQGCTQTAVSTVTVYPLPSPNIVSNSPVCVGGTLSLIGSGGASYSWTGPSSFNNSSQSPNINNVTLANGGVYTLLVSSGSCTASITSTVVINPLPNPVINSNSPVCIGNPINLTGAGGANYLWTGPFGFNDVAQNPTITPAILANTGTYTLTVVDANNCVNTTTANVLVNPQPTVMATGTTVCENANAQLTSSGGISYSWAGPDNFTSNFQNPIVFSVPLTGAGQYTVLVTDANTCTNIAVTSIGINPAPTPTAISNSPICINDNLNLTSNGGVSYVWTGPNGFMSTLQNPGFAAGSTAYSGTYSVTVTDANGCVASTGLTATVNPLPVPTITSNNFRGCAPICVTFTAQSSPTAANASWNLGNGAFSTGVLNTTGCYSTEGTFTVSADVTDVNGCRASAFYTIEVYPQPVADFNHAPLKPVINVDSEVEFTDASHGAPIVGWNWYFMNNAQYQSIQQNPHFIYTEPGEYVVALVVKSDQGCYDTILRPLVIAEDFGLYVPNAFTPNGDNLNDTFQPKGFGITKYELSIFDRWGEKLFTSNELEKGWDGFYQSRGGKLCPNDTYVWIIKLTSVFSKAHEFTGHVTLMK
jgi:gliding motility-associated-like protein